MHPRPGPAPPLKPTPPLTLGWNATPAARRLCRGAVGDDRDREGGREREKGGGEREGEKKRVVAAAGLPARRDGAGLVCGATRVASGSRGLGSWSAWYAARCKGVESRGGGQECRRRWKREKPQGAASRAVAEEICGCKQPFSAAAAALDRGCAVTEEKRRCTALRQSEHLALA